VHAHTLEVLALKTFTTEELCLEVLTHEAEFQIEKATLAHGIAELDLLPQSIATFAY